MPTMTTSLTRVLQTTSDPWRTPSIGGGLAPWTESEGFVAVHHRHLVWDGSALNDLLPRVAADRPLCDTAFEPSIDQ